MSYDGNGVFNRLYNWVQDAASGINIMADRMDAEMDGFAQGLSICLTRDGQAAMIADLNMGGFAIVSLKDPTDPQHAATKKYVDGFLPLAGGKITGELKIAPTSLLTPLVFNTRAVDSVVDCAFRNNLNETAKSWVQRVNVTEASPIFQWRYDDVGVMTLNGLDKSLTLTGPLRLPAGVAERSPLRIPQGVAPSSPVNGDIWTQAEGIFARINGVNVNLSLSVDEQNITAAGQTLLRFDQVPAEAASLVLLFNNLTWAAADLRLNFTNAASQTHGMLLQASGAAYTPPVATSFGYTPLTRETDTNVTGAIFLERLGLSTGSEGWFISGVYRTGNTQLSLSGRAIRNAGALLTQPQLSLPASGAFTGGSVTCRWRL